MVSPRHRFPLALELSPTPVPIPPSWARLQLPPWSQPLVLLPPSTSAAPSSASLPQSPRSPCSKRRNLLLLYTTNLIITPYDTAAFGRLITILLPALLVQCAGDAFARFDVYMKAFSR